MKTSKERNEAAIKRALAFAFENKYLTKPKPRENELLPPWAREVPAGYTLRDLKSILVLQALHRHNQNRTHTCRELGIALRTMSHLLKRAKEDGWQVCGPKTGLKKARPHAEAKPKAQDKV